MSHMSFRFLLELEYAEAIVLGAVSYRLLNLAFNLAESWCLFRGQSALLRGPPVRTQRPAVSGRSVYDELSVGSLRVCHNA